MTGSPPAELTRRLSLRTKVQLAVEIVVTYGQVRWWLWRTPLPETVSALRARRRERPGPVGRREQLIGIRLGWIVARTVGLLPADSRCLVRSLVLTSLLARRGIDSSLVIGVKPQPDFAAHAWVETGGVPLLPARETTFSRLVEI